ncbi:hypothetical protein GLUCOINTEAF2_0202182 [Komagataeibacter intermedius AF2]|uniref:Uncharacterized protein n=1 Tax=Komagataeibacter intermedius AF2 TaxID=1458464 RepID=A0A0C1UYH9_9PROT|nr:hypothetical protein GLUCOINTEAF2_0200726 [Komagataeibacter intermedius AF2]KPH87345.1 hypothetical protein GLUCOINTEAF2_0202182 [Komagataeibacter intermedius AF2]
MPITAMVTACALVSYSKSLMKLRSILISVSGRRVSRESDEYPVPKSSIDRPQPRLRMDCSTSSVSRLLSIITLSVISTVRRAGLRLWSFSRAAMCSGSARLRKCTADRLTATVGT